MKRSSQAAFTLIELIVAMAVAAILMGVGVPSFVETVKDGKLASEATCLSLSLFAARSEAVKRSATVSMCARQGDSQCGTDWRKGSLVFLDSVPGADDVAARVDAADTVIRRCPPLSADNRIVALGSDDGTAGGASERSHIRYLASGQTNWDNGFFAICDDRAASRWKAINVGVTGEVRSARMHADGDARLNAFNAKIRSCG